MGLRPYVDDMNARLPAVAIATLVLAIGGAACGDDEDESPKPVAEVAAVKGKTTSLAFDQAFIGVLIGVESEGKPVGGAKLSDTGVATFPITGGNLEYFEPGTVSPFVQGRLEHEGSGVTLQSATTAVTLEDFVVDPGRSVLTGKVSVDGKVAVERASLFVLDGRTLEPLKRESGSVILDGSTVRLRQEAADVLNDAFETKDFQTTGKVGTATITVATG